MSHRLKQESRSADSHKAAQKSAQVERLKASLSPEQYQSYRKHFDLFDLNGDGAISARELRKVSRQMGYRLDDSQIEAIIAANDLDANGSMNFDEFLLSMAANLKLLSEDEHRRAEVRRMFAEFDRDGNGIVTMEEAHAILQKELGFTPVQSANLVRRYDVNGDGQLNYDEFVLFYYKVRTKLDRVRKMFEEFDQDKSGSVSLSEVKPVLLHLGMTDKQIAELVARYDSNKDGELQYDEFVNFLWES